MCVYSFEAYLKFSFGGYSDRMWQNVGKMEKGAQLENGKLLLSALAGYVLLNMNDGVRIKSRIPVPDLEMRCGNIPVQEEIFSRRCVWDVVEQVGRRRMPLELISECKLGLVGADNLSIRYA